MAVLTPVSLEDARRIGREYGLSIATIRGILAGSVNTNYECLLDDGRRAFLRVYEEQDAEGASREARLLSHLKTQGVPTVGPLLRAHAGDRDTPTLSSYSNKAAAIFPWVEGEILCQKRVTPEVMEHVGRALAQIHVAAETFAGIGPSRFDVRHLMGRIEKLRTSGYGRTAEGAAISGGEIGRDVERLAAKLAEYETREQARGEAAPHTVIHGDIFRDNVLWHREGIAAVLDFESASWGPVTFDLCVTMLAWCYDDTLRPDLARALGRGYTAHRPLTSADRERLFDDAIFAALRFSVTRITDYELRPKGTGIYKNYRRFLGRLAAIEALGPQGVNGLFP